MSETKKKKNHVKVSNLPRNSKKLSASQAANIKGGAGNAGAGGGDPRSITRLQEN